MQVTTVSAAVRFSKDTGAGWKTIDIGAEASLDPDDDWVVAQQGLYTQLTIQLWRLWQQKNGVTAEHGQNGPEKAVATSPDWGAMGKAYPHGMLFHRKRITAKNTRPTSNGLKKMVNIGTPILSRVGVGVRNSPC